MQLIKSKTPKTVDDVMGVFHKTIAELETVADAADDTVDDLNEERAELDQQIESARKESHRAKKIKAQLVTVIDA